MYKNNGLIKSFTPSAPISPFRAVKFGSSDSEIALATSSTDLVIGFTTELETTADDVANGTPSDVVMSGIAEAKAGAAIARGTRLVVDSTGRVIAATGVNRADCRHCLSVSNSRR